MKQSLFFGMIKERHSLLKRFVMLFLLIFATGTLVNTVHGQAVYTDKVDYMPGDVVTISGFSWKPGEVVNVVLTENYLNPQGSLITTKNFTCDSQGKFTGTLHTVVEANLGAFFQVKATGSITNHVCTTVFHDAGGDYSIDYSAYDPQFYLRRTLASFAPGFFPFEGNHVSPLGSGGTSGFTMHTRTVESLSPQHLGLGQIVAFEFYLTANSGGVCPDDKISFGGTWSTLTQNSGNFGFDPAYMVIAAFVDPSPETPLYNDSGTPASARILSNELDGTDIRAMFEVSGLDPGDSFPVEVWLVLKSSIAQSVGSNVPTGAENGLTLGTCESGQVVKMGNQTIPLLQAGDFYTTNVDLAISKSDSQDPVAIGTAFYYTITVTNNGPSVANNITISDILNSNLNVDVDAITFSHNISTGYAEDLSWSHTFDISTHTLTLTKLSIDIGETIYIRIPVTWIAPYSGTKTAGAAGSGSAGSSCTGDLINQVSVTTISSDTNSANNSYCQPTNVLCSAGDVNAGLDKVLNCIATSVILDGSSSTPGATFSWIATGGGHIVSGENTATPTVDAAGTYTVTVTDPASGCTATDFAVVTLNNALPNANAGADKILTCIVTQIALSGSSSTEGAAFSWSGPGIVSGGATATPTVNAAGTYILTVTAPNGCTSTDNALVTLDNALPNANAGADKILTCTVTQIALSGSSSTEGAAFSWSGPGIVSGGATATPTVNAAGTYILTVTAPNGCTSTDNALVTLDNALPNANAGADKILTCTVTQIALSGSSSTEGAAFSWSGPGIVSGGATATPTVNAAGTYILTVTAPNGCTSTDNALVTLDNALPNANAGADKILTCTVTQIALSGSSSTEGAAFSWSGPGIVSGGTTATPTVNAAGTYILTVTAPNGCTSTDNALITLDNALPNANAGADKILTCTVTQIALSGSSSTEGAAFSWSGPGIVSGGATATPTVNAAGTYILTVTAPNGCTSTDNALVTLDNALPNANAGADKILTCTVTQIALSGSSSTEGAAFSWSGPGIVSGGATATPTVNAAGTYILTVTAPNGCTSTDNALVTLDNALPNANAGADKILTCTVTQIALSGSSSTEGAAFSWSGPGIVSGGATATPTVNAAGTYILTVTAPNGCTSTDNALVTLDNALPNANAGADKILTCTVTQIALSGSSSTEGATFSWSGPGIVSGGNTATPTVNAAGTYILTVTAPNGCIASDMAEVKIETDKEPPVIVCPAPVTVPCALAIPEPVIPSATDNCGIAKVEWIGDVKSNEVCEGQFIITRTYRATDVNGLTSECTQVITVHDNIAPVLKKGATFPVGQTNMNLCKSSIPAGPSVEELKALFEDNCGGNVIVVNLGGQVTGDDCSWSVTYTYRVKDACYNEILPRPTITYSGGDKTPPVLKPGASFPVGKTGMNLCKSSIPAGPSVEEIKALYIDNCGGPITVINLGGTVTGDDCSWSVTYTYRVKDACYNEILPRPTITFSGGDKTAPVLKPGATFPAGQTGMDLCLSSVPAGPSVDELKALYIDNCGGPVTVISLGGTVTGDDSNWSVTYTYRVKDACQNEVLPVPSVTYSGGDMTAPVLKPGATIPAGQSNLNLPMSSIPQGPSAEEIKALFMDNCGNDIVVIKTGEPSGTNSSWSVTYTYSVRDASGNEVLTVPAVTYRGSDKTPPVIQLYNADTEYIVEGCDFDFRLPEPSANGSCSGEVELRAYIGSTEIDLKNYKFENEGTTIVTFLATDACGNTSTANVIVNREECIDLSHCTYTQEWYGTQGGAECAFINGAYQKTDALTMMQAALGDNNSIIFGYKSTDKYFELMKQSISGSKGHEGIFQLMPGGGTPAALLGPATSLDLIGRTAKPWENVPRSTDLANRGQIMNTLLSQTIALFFNLENDESLGEFEIRGRYMVTQENVECGSEIGVPNTSLYTEFPQSVLDYFTANNLSGTVADLFKLANDVLGGIVTTVTPADVEKAVGAINKGFDGCRILVEFSQVVPNVPKASAGATVNKTAVSKLNNDSEVTLTVYPNPFAQVAKFEIEMLRDSRIRIDIFTHSGTLLDVLINENLTQGDVRTLEFDGSKYPQSSFLYRITTSTTFLNGTIIKAR